MKIMITHDFFGGVLSVWICVFEKLLTHSRKVHHHVGIEGVIGKDVELLGLAEIRKIISSLRFENCSFLLSSTLWYRRGMWQGLSGRSILYVYEHSAFCLIFLPQEKKSGSFRRRAYVYCGDQRTHLRVQNVDRLLVLALFGFLEGWQPGFVPEMYLR